MIQAMRSNEAEKEGNMLLLRNQSYFLISNLDKGWLIIEEEQYSHILRENWVNFFLAFP